MDRESLAATGESAPAITCCPLGGPSRSHDDGGGGEAPRVRAHRGGRRRSGVSARSGAQEARGPRELEPSRAPAVLSVGVAGAEALCSSVQSTRRSDIPGGRPRRRGAGRRRLGRVKRASPAARRLAGLGVGRMPFSWSGHLFGGSVEPPPCAFHFQRHPGEPSVSLAIATPPAEPLASVEALFTRPASATQLHGALASHHDALPAR